MTLTIPREPLFILGLLRQAGFDASIVGGAVRDLIRHVSTEHTVAPPDYDFTTNATPEQISALFPESFYENTFGTVSVTHQHLLEKLEIPLPVPPVREPPSPQRIIDIAQAKKIHISLQNSLPSVELKPRELFEPFEITTYRADGTYSDHRRPDAVTWGATLRDDLDRRDFTINALAITVDDTLLSKLLKNPTLAPEQLTLSENEFTIIDVHNGLQDLAEHRLVTVGDPEERFQEDALRLLRAIRFSVQLNFEIADETFAALTKLSPLIEHVSAERIRDEFLKMLASPYPKQAIELLDTTGLLQYILPELLQAKGVEQSGHHTTDVWTHSLDALEACPSPDPIVRLATLLHDIAKPQTAAEIGGQITFYNHEVIGARTAKRIAERLRLSKHDCERMFILVRYHMFHYDKDHTDAAIRRFMRKVGLQHIDDILALREGDRLGSGARKTSWRLEEMKQRMIEQLNQPLAVTDLALNGTTLMQELALQPGPLIGETLHYLFEQVLDTPELNTAEQLLELARTFLAQRALPAA